MGSRPYIADWKVNMTLVEGLKYRYTLTQGGVTNKYLLTSLYSGRISEFSDAFFTVETPQVWAFTSAQLNSVDPYLLPGDCIVNLSTGEVSCNPVQGTIRYSQLAGYLTAPGNTFVPEAYAALVEGEAGNITYEMDVWDFYRATPEESRFALLYFYTSGMRCNASIVKVENYEVRLKVYNRLPITNYYSLHDNKHQLTFNYVDYTVVNDQTPDSSTSTSATYNITGAADDFTVFRLYNSAGTVHIQKGALNEEI